MPDEHSSPDPSQTEDPDDIYLCAIAPRMAKVPPADNHVLDRLMNDQFLLSYRQIECLAKTVQWEFFSNLSHADFRSQI